MASFMYIHENTHAVIFQEYGCTYRFGFTWEGAYTEGRCPLISAERSVSLDEAQANVEAIGYQLLLPTLLLAGIFLVLLDLRFHWSS